MRIRPLVALALATSVVLGGISSATADPAASTAEVTVTPRMLPAANAPVISGTPQEILNETPVAEPLNSGWESGMFIPKGAFNEKDAKGCLYKKQLLIAMSVKKPSIGPGCTLLGGEWLVDFGSRRVKGR